MSVWGFMVFSFMCTIAGVCEIRKYVDEDSPMAMLLSSILLSGAALLMALAVCLHK